MIKQLTAIIEREGDGYFALCPELDIASQGASVSEARANLKEALGAVLRDGFGRRSPTPALRRSLCDACRGRGWLGSACTTYLAQIRSYLPYGCQVAYPLLPKAGFL